MTAYEVVAFKDGAWWTFKVPSVYGPALRPGEKVIAMGQARYAKDVPAEAHDVISLWTGTEDFTVHVTYSLPDDVESVLTRAGGREQIGREALAEAATLRRDAIHTLVRFDMSQADIATILGVSRQRIQQLASQ
ncbi:hypothetical protein [Devriesea agamarum]|uniref:hypothetical protein n=1 Tax=Devriesea agamarum TaxID=472569 RepID=UPI00071D0A5D|nr:hypothetical protein [Devriesea agamarum]